MSSNVATDSKEITPLDRQLNTLVDKRTEDKVRYLAFLQRVSRAEIVRRAISSYLAMHEDSLRDTA